MRRKAKEASFESEFLGQKSWMGWGHCCNCKSHWRIAPALEEIYHNDQLWRYRLIVYAQDRSQIILPSTSSNWLRIENLHNFKPSVLKTIFFPGISFYSLNISLKLFVVIPPASPKSFRLICFYFLFQPGSCSFFRSLIGFCIELINYCLFQNLFFFAILESREKNNLVI